MFDQAPPGVQAEVAAIVFEGQEEDRWMKLNSFIYRHAGAFIGIGFLLIFGSVGSIFLLAAKQASFDTDTKTRLLSYAIYVAFAGILWIMFVFARLSSPNNRSAALKVFGIIALLLVVLVPILIGIDALMRLMI